MLRQILLFSTLIIILSSCFDYEPEVNNMVYQDKDHALSDLLLEDWGAHSAEHYNYDFSFIGAKAKFEKKITSAGDEYIFVADTVDWFVITEFFAPSTKKFLPGTYASLGSRDIEDIDAHEFVFRKLVFGRNGRSSLEALNGTITISEKGSDSYRFVYDITLENDLKLTLKYEGVPLYRDMRN